MQNWVLTELDSGERVISERLEHVRSAAVGYWIGAGSRDERAGEAGVTHFIEHLLFKGTARYSALEIAEIFDGLGGELNAATSREHTLIYARIPDHHLETAMDVMSEMVFEPAFAELAAGARARPDLRGGVRRPSARPSGDRDRRCDLDDSARIDPALPRRDVRP